MSRVKPGSPARHTRRKAALVRLKQHLKNDSSEEHVKRHQKELESLEK